jgi:ribosomal-protein-alanine N-acetyltransferase
MNFQFKVMELLDLKRVLEIEAASHSHPWSKKNFEDCISQKYWNYVLFVDLENEINYLGHSIVMPGVEELHLLNITIAPDFRRQNIATQALLAIENMGQEHAFAKILLEVRKSNIHAIKLYEKLAYQVIGIRKDYYSVDGNPSSREDALVMEKMIR